MRQLERVDQIQLMMFACIYAYASNIGFLINPIIGAGSYGSWIALLSGYILALPFVYITVYVCEKIPNKSFLENGDKIVTKGVHLFFLVYIGFYFFHYSSLLSRLFQDFMIQTYLPTTPEWMISSLISLLAVVAVWSGIESIFRFVQLFFFLTLVSAAMTPLFVVTDLEYDMLVAFIKHFNFVEIIGTSLYTVPWFSDIIIIVLFYHLITDSKKSLKSITIGMGLTTILLLPNLFITIMVFRPYYASDLTYPILEVIRQISIANFIENLDPILVAIWMTGMCVKFSICLYGTTVVLAKLLKIKNYRMLVPPMGLIMFGYSMQMDGTATEINHFITQAWSGFGWTVTCIPIIYFIALKIRGRVNNNAEISSSS